LLAPDDDDLIDVLLDGVAGEPAHRGVQVGRPCGLRALPQRWGRDVPEAELLVVEAEALVEFPPLGVEMVKLVLIRVPLGLLVAARLLAPDPVVEDGLPIPKLLGAGG